MSLNLITRQEGTDPLIAEPFAADVIQDTPKFSAAMQMCRIAPMSTKTLRQPVLDVLPQAYWVNGDTGIKSTTKQAWKNVILDAQEIAVIVPIPEAYMDDTAIKVWDEVRPRVAAAFGEAIDAAILFGVNKPSAWNDYPSIVPGAIDIGNVVPIGASGKDIGADIALMGEGLAAQGQSLNAFSAGPGFTWRLVGQRTEQGNPIYGAGDISKGIASNLYGRRLAEIENGTWDNEQALLLGGDASRAIIGTRQDMTVKLFTEGVITDSDNNIVLNLMQQDSVALRFVMRLGYALANPVNQVERDATKRFPFAVLQGDPGTGFGGVSGFDFSGFSAPVEGDGEPVEGDGEPVAKTAKTAKAAA